MLVPPNNILVVGLDVRPTTGYSSHEAGADHSESRRCDRHADGLARWRRDVTQTLDPARHARLPPLLRLFSEDQRGLVLRRAKGDDPGSGDADGLKINHMIVVDLGNFVKFIDDIGGVTVKTPRICSKISAARNGGYALNLAPARTTSPVFRP